MSPRTSSDVGGTDVVLAAPPRLGPLYARALAGQVRRHRPAGLAGTRAVVVPRAVVDGEHVARFTRVVGARLTDDAPPTYPHLLAFGTQVHLMATQPFPFPLLGLVHVRQVVAQHRPLRGGDAVAVRVWAEHLAPHAKGATVDLRALLTDADTGEPLWEGRSRYLARGAEAPATSPVAGPGTEPPDLPELVAPTGAANVMWPVGSDAGRRYAAVSGDVNPIHLAAPTARALGFRRAIAHGMYTAGRVMTALPPGLPAAVHLDFLFGRPVMLPSTLAVLVRPVADDAAPGNGGFKSPAGEGFDVAVRSTSMAHLHLTATVRPGAREV